jgi:hypothetical protein
MRDLGLDAKGGKNGGYGNDSDDSDYEDYENNIVGDWEESPLFK